MFEPSKDDNEIIQKALENRIISFRLTKTGVNINIVEYLYDLKAREIELIIDVLQVHSSAKIN